MNFCADAFLHSESRILDRSAFLAFACDDIFALRTVRIGCRFDLKAKEWVAKKVFGARPLKRLLQRHVETKIDPCINRWRSG